MISKRVKQSQMVMVTVVWVACYHLLQYERYFVSQRLMNEANPYVRSPYLVLGAPFYVYEELLWLDEATVIGEVSLKESIERLNYKHSDDYWFLAAALRHPMRTRDPEKAKLFVVPTLLNEFVTQLIGLNGLCFEGMCDQELLNFTDMVFGNSSWFKRYGEKQGICYRGLCSPKKLINHADEILGKSPWFRRNRGNDHIVVASHSASSSFAKTKNIVQCHAITHELRNWNHPDRVAIPKIIVGSPCDKAEKAFDFAMIASIKDTETFKSRKNICNWMNHNQSRYNMSVCGSGQQCPALAQSRFGFHVRGDTYGSNRLMDTLLSGTVPIFTHKEQYDVLPDWIDWEKLSYFADVTGDRNAFLSSIDDIQADQYGYEQKLEAIVANRDLFDWKTLTPFDTTMYMLLCHLEPEYCRENDESPYSALILNRPEGFRVFGKRSVICDIERSMADHCGLCPRGRGEEGCFHKFDCHWCEHGAMEVEAHLGKALREVDKCVHATEQCRTRKDDGFLASMLRKIVPR